MTAMDDSALSGVTGQDGISISGNFSGTDRVLWFTPTVMLPLAVELRMENH